MVELVVRHVSGGAARDITFEISEAIEDSSGFVLSDLRYLREGIPFLGPGEKIRCLWDRLDRLVTYFDEKDLNEGIAVKVNYKDLTGEAYATEWRINPLLYEGLRYDANQLAQEPSEPRYLPRWETNTGTGTSKDPLEGGETIPTSSANGPRQRGLQRGDPTRTHVISAW